MSRRHRVHTSAEVRLTGFHFRGDYVLVVRWCLHLLAYARHPSEVTTGRDEDVIDQHWVGGVGAYANEQADGQLGCSEPGLGDAVCVCVGRGRSVRRCAAADSLEGSSQGLDRRCYRCDGACECQTQTTSGMAPLPRSPRSRWPPANRQRLLSAAPPPEFLRFLKQVANTYPVRKLHIPLDNYNNPRTHHRDRRRNHQQ
jgi:hypothetical protein